MGAVASVSLLPLLTCPDRCTGTCGKLCYAAKLSNLRPVVCTAYAINTALAIHRPELYWQGIVDAVRKVKWFRFHVSGDIINMEYLKQMIHIANTNQHCEILCFTKRYEIINDYLEHGGSLPSNLHLLMSGWDQLIPTNPFHLPETNVILKGKEPQPNWTLCGGNCFNCACHDTGCWTAQPGEIIAFHQH